MEGCVTTLIQELFRAGIAIESLQELVDAGVDTGDIKLLYKHWNELNVTHDAPTP